MGLFTKDDTKPDKAEGPNGPVPPKLVEDRIKRGADAQQRVASEVDCCWEFFRGNQYVWVSAKGQLYRDSTVHNHDGSGKPRHRVRQVRNLVRPQVEAKVSAATQRTPGYECTPTSTDPEDIGAAKWAERAALHGYDKWNILRARTAVATHALVGRGGWAMPYFDNTVGPYIEAEDGTRVGQGEIKIRTFGRNRVGWEPGCQFEDSRWFFIREARPPEDVMSLNGYVGGGLVADAVSSEQAAKSQSPPEAKLVLVTEYFERPSPKVPDGRHMVIANGKVVCPPAKYPCVDKDGQVLDEPILHRLMYTMDPEADDDLGLVGTLIDPQRTYNDCNNKQLEHKNLALNHQTFSLPNVLRQPLTDEPGANFEVHDLNGIKERQPPPVPADLYRLKEEAKADMIEMSAANDIPPQIESAKAVQAVQEKAEMAWSRFLVQLAQFDARLMRHCLYLVQRHYTEPRLLSIRGRTGWEYYPDFTGAKIKDQVDVRVAPTSIEPRTKAQVEQRVMNIVTMFPGWLTPEKAVRAIEAGTAAELIESYERDLGRAHRLIQRMKQDPEGLLAAPMRFDSQLQQDVPEWMPRRYDALPIHKSVFEDWFKTPEFEEVGPAVQEIGHLIYEGILWLEAEQQAREQMMQAQTAEQQGMSNAVKPAQQKPMPSLPAANGAS